MTPTQPTDAELRATIARVKELDTEATKGPWAEDLEGAPPCYIVAGDPSTQVPVVCQATTCDDGILIADYRTSALALADACERLLQRVAALEADKAALRISMQAALPWMRQEAGPRHDRDAKDLLTSFDAALEQTK